MPTSTSSAKEPFPLLNVDAPDSSASSSTAQHGAVRRTGWASEGNGSLATSLAHLSGVDVAAGGSIKVSLGRWTLRETAHSS